MTATSGPKFGLSTERPVGEYGRAAGIDYLRWRAPRSAGVPIVFLHGIGSNAASWSRLAADPSRSYDMIAWNAPGYGGSKALPSDSPRPEHYAEALHEMLSALGIETMILVGHSLGALFAAAFAANAPRRVCAVGLLSPANGYSVKVGEGLPAKVKSRIDDLQRLGAAAFAAGRASRLMGDPLAQPDVLSEIQMAMSSVRTAGYGDACRALAAGNLLDEAPRLPMPTIVAVGGRDPITLPTSARAIYERLPNPAGYEELAEIGHAMPQEAPARTAVAIARLHGRFSGVSADLGRLSPSRNRIGGP